MGRQPVTGSEQEGQPHASMKHGTHAGTRLPAPMTWHTCGRRHSGQDVPADSLGARPAPREFTTPILDMTDVAPRGLRAQATTSLRTQPKTGRHPESETAGAQVAADLPRHPALPQGLVSPKPSAHGDASPSSLTSLLRCPDHTWPSSAGGRKRDKTLEDSVGSKTGWPTGSCRLSRPMLLGHGSASCLRGLLQLLPLLHQAGPPCKPEECCIPFSIRKASQVPSTVATTCSRPQSSWGCSPKLGLPAEPNE